MVLVSRKAQQIRNSMFVSIPQQWAIDNNVRRGEQLDIEQDQQGRLVISVRKEVSE